MQFKIGPCCCIVFAGEEISAWYSWTTVCSNFSTNLLLGIEQGKNDFAFHCPKNPCTIAYFGRRRRWQGRTRFAVMLFVCRFSVPQPSTPRASVSHRSMYTLQIFRVQYGDVSFFVWHRRCHCRGRIADQDADGDSQIYWKGNKHLSLLLEFITIAIIAMSSELS